MTTTMKKRKMKTSKSDFTKTCVRCALHRHRTRVVFGKGSKRSGIVICGEAPGKDEDRKGRPFVGRCGKLLKTFLKSAGLRRKDVFITNACLCRPLNNRPPSEKEIKACRPRLLNTLRQLRGRCILLGLSASKAVLGIEHPVWGTVYRKYGLPMVCVKHPGWYLKGHMDYLAFGEKEFMNVVKSLLELDADTFKNLELDYSFDLDRKKREAK
jgi:uracil-DNA glycosylase